MFQEYPKVIYLAGDTQAAYVVVNNDKEQAAAIGYEPGKSPKEAPANEAPKSKKAK